MAGLMSPPGYGPEDVDNFMAFTNTFDNPEIAKDYLSNNNNDVSKAIDEWFRLLDPNHYKTRAVKNGAANQMQEVNPWSALAAGSTTSHGLTQPAPASTENKSRPPSRPPSRAHNSTEWAAWGETDPMATGLSNNEDVQMQEALELSRLDQVPTTSVAPKILDPEPKARMRKSGQPAFLKPLPSGDFLPALITILRSIPKIRNELLSKDDFLPDYRWTEHWWEGETIESSRVKPANQDDNAPKLDILHEVQRLIAFLEFTTRAYGNVEPLLKLISGTGVSNHESPSVKFLEEWEAAAQSYQADTDRHLGPVQSLFKSNITVSPSAESNVSPEEMAWRVMIPATHLPASPGSSLYEAVDNALLGRLGEERVLFHTEFAPVLLICLENGTTNKNMSIPSEFFIDRYLEPNWDFIKSSRAMAQEEISNNEAVIDKIGRLETFKSSQATQRGDALKLMSTALAHLKHQQSQNMSGANSESPNGVLNEENDHNSASSRALEKLLEIETKIQSRLKALNEEKQSREERIRSYSKIGTLPDEPQFPAKERYILRGVSTSHHQQPCIYALHTSQDETSGPADEDFDASQWWKMIYDTRFSASIRNEVVTRDQVLEAAGEMATSTLLVYVEEQVLASVGGDVQIPPQLKEFVEKDNASFYAETDDPFAENPVIEIEGVPVEDGKSFDWSRSDSDTLNLEPGPGQSIEMRDVEGPTIDPTRVEGNDLSSKLEEIEVAGTSGALSPKKRKKYGDDGADSSDLETMAPDSDIDMS